MIMYLWQSQNNIKDLRVDSSLVTDIYFHVRGEMHPKSHH
jgi:hypothetical protein